MAHGMRRLVRFSALVNASRRAVDHHQVLSLPSLAISNPPVASTSLSCIERSFVPRWHTSIFSASYTSSRPTHFAASTAESSGSTSSSTANSSNSGGNGSNGKSQSRNRGSTSSDQATTSHPQTTSADADSNGGTGDDIEHDVEEASSSDADAETLRLRAQVEKLTDGVKRGLADMENLRQRTAREMDSTRKFAVQGFAKGLFDVADNLARAIEAVPPAALEEGTSMPPEQLASVLKGLVGGLHGVEKMLLQALKGSGVEQYNPVGEAFDPNLHSALFEIQDPSKEAGTIAVVTKRGYKMHDRVVRPAEVGVVKA